MTVRYTFVVSNFTQETPKHYLHNLFQGYGFESVQISTSLTTRNPYAYLTLTNIGTLEDFLQIRFLNQKGDPLNLHFISKKTVDIQESDKKTRRMTLG